MSAVERAPRRKSPLILALLAAAPVVIASVLGQTATYPNIPGWYEGLSKPPLNPPNWLFGPVWTLLYVLMACGFFRILRQGQSSARRTAIFAFLAQMTLNAVWSFAFFAARSPLLGLCVIIPLEMSIIATIFIFARLDRISAYCLWPYAAWVGFAIYLNASIWALNR